MQFDRNEFTADLRRAIAEVPPEPVPPVVVKVAEMPTPRSWRMLPLRDADGLITEVLLEPLP